MSRSDQWIGLTREGEEWFSKQKGVHRTKEPIGFYAFNFPEEIYGREVQVEGKIYREHIQVAPWSSGPMYFTNVMVLDKDGNFLEWKFSWKEDERVFGEVDYDNGKYYI